MPRYFGKPSEQELIDYLANNGYESKGLPYSGSSIFGFFYEMSLIGYKNNEAKNMYIWCIFGYWRIQSVKSCSDFTKDEISVLASGRTPQFHLNN
jgi:hypothetical protein